MPSEALRLHEQWQILLYKKSEAFSLIQFLLFIVLVKLQLVIALLAFSNCDLHRTRHHTHTPNYLLKMDSFTDLDQFLVECDSFPSQVQQSTIPVDSDTEVPYFSGSCIIA